MPYVDGFVTPVPEAGRAAYLAFAARAWERFRELGALSAAECWGDQVPDGTLTDFRRAVRAEAGEAVVFSWIFWPDKPTRDAAWAGMSTDAAMAALGGMPFDGRRMIYGGFDPVLLTEAAA